MKVIIIEDETLTAERLQQLLKRHNERIEILAHLKSVKQALGWLEEHPAPELIFLDIELGDGMGFDVLEKSETSAPVIFTTAYHEFALKAFQYNSLHYLLKPVEFEELQKAMHKIQPRLQQAPDTKDADWSQMKQLLRQDFKTRFMVKIGDQFKHIAVADLAYVRFEDGFAMLTTHAGQSFPSDYSLDQIEGMLNPLDFFRLNRKMIASIESIRQVHTYFNSRLLIQLAPEIQEEVIVSRDRVGNFKKWLDL